jgi:AraC-like DNA-binding protein
VTIKGRAGEVLLQTTLLNGRHYGDAGDGVAVDRINGDGTRVVTVGKVEINGEVHRVDEFRVECGGLAGVQQVLFVDLGTPASFVIFEAVGEFSVAQCPFRGHGGGVSLSEVGSIVRLRDWGRFEVALAQLRSGVVRDDLDGAKGAVLTFLAVVSAAILDLGGERKLHRFQLDAARRLDELTSVERVSDLAEELALSLVADVMPHPQNDGARAIDRAIRLIETRFAQPLTDHEVAYEVGLSTSHFRHLFKERAGVPFHRFVLNMRLEQARRDVVASDQSIREIASALGFVSSAHFSRAFHQRFGMAPKQLRDAAGSRLNAG